MNYPESGLQDFSATWFDGVSAQRRDAAVAIGRDSVQVRAVDRVSDYRVDTLRLSTPVAGVPLRIALPDGSTLIVRDQDEKVAALLGQPRRSVAYRLEQNLPFVFVALILLGAIMFFAYRDGVPWLAAKVATRVPHAAEAQLGETILKALDHFAFEKSTLPEEKSAEVTDAFDRLVAAADAPALELHLELRHAKSFVGANALAIPGGTVVVTDQLIDEVSGVDKVAAVLAHEIGHQVRRHALVQLLQGSAIALIFGAVAGDISGVGSIAAAAPGLVLRLNYSRNAEDEADRFAYDLLQKTGASPALLGDALEDLVRSRCKATPADAGSDNHDDEDNANAEERSRGCTGKPAKPGTRIGYLSTHPAIESRIANARAAANR